MQNAAQQHRRMQLLAQSFIGWHQHVLVQQQRQAAQQLRRLRLLFRR